MHSTMISLAFHQFLLFAGKERVVDQAHYHRNMNLRLLDVLMPICYTIYGRHTHWHTGIQMYPSRECVIQNKLAEPIEYRARGTVFFLSFLVGWQGSTDWSGSSFVECHNKSMEIQIVEQSHTPTAKFCGYYGIPGNDTKATAKTKPHATARKGATLVITT